MKLFLFALLLSACSEQTYYEVAGVSYENGVPRLYVCRSTTTGFNGPQYNLRICPNAVECNDYCDKARTEALKK